MSDKDVKIDGSSRLQFYSGYTPNIQGFVVFFLIFIYI